MKYMFYRMYFPSVICIIIIFYTFVINTHADWWSVEVEKVTVGELDITRFV